MYNHRPREEFFKAPDSCIYCGSHNGARTAEHIIPFALNGNLVIPSAVCKKCQEHTNKEIENKLLRESFGICRVKLGYNSRTKKKDRIKNYTGIVKILGTEIEIDLPINSFPMMAFHVPPKPAILDGNPYVDGMTDFRVHICNTSPSNQIPFANFGIKTEWISGLLELELAKIAHSFAQALGLFKTYKSTLHDHIIHNAPGIFSYVGTLNEENLSMQRIDGRKTKSYSIEMYNLNYNNKIFLLCKIRLFSEINAPFYDVICGEI